MTPEKRLRIVLLLFIGIGGGFLLVSDAGSQEEGGRSDTDSVFEVHEWGTFTSVAGSDGSATPWYATGLTAPLPSFVRGTRYAKTIHDFRVRMETPVVYFYADQERTVHLRVRMKEGVFSEHYPRARPAHSTPERKNPPLVTVNIKDMKASMKWKKIRVHRNRSGSFSGDESGNHYYDARKTDANPVSVPGKEGRQFEKFLFYRGATQWDHPVQVRYEEEKIHLSAPSSFQGRTAVVFDRQGKNLRLRNVKLQEGEQVLNRSALRAKPSMKTIRDMMTKFLEKRGLFEKEAKAMVDTWEDVWFRQGLRVFYPLPQSIVKKRLPMQIKPEPDRLERVMVWQTEILTPASLERVRQLVLDVDPSQDREKLIDKLKNNLGRFWRITVRRLVTKTESETLKKRLYFLLNNEEKRDQDSEQEANRQE